MSKLIFEKHVKGSNSFTLPPADIPEVEIKENIPSEYLRKKELNLPEVSKIEAVRHFIELSHQAYGVDSGLYPLGSCTMKYNPKINEWAARLPGLAHIHPYQTVDSVQGALRILFEMEKMLCKVAGMDNFTLQPAAGAHGELTGVLMIKKYHQARGDKQRTKIIVPDSAHGTNPATANVVGYDIVEVKSDQRGLVDIDDLQSKMNAEVACLMLTNPNTLGLFEEDIQTIADIVHANGGLLYYDGANLNGIMGIARPGDMGFDVVHLNLHKTFGTPHGGGGPGSGPVGVKAFLADFLPKPIIVKHGDRFNFQYFRPLSIGRVKNFYGNFGVIVRAYAYLKALGSEGIAEACQNAVLNANYLRYHISKDYHIPYDRLCKHEFVATSRYQLAQNHVTALDIAKRIIDYGYHPPTVYFPLIVKEALMIEPTETESRERLDDFIKALQEIAKEAKNEPEKVLNAPQGTAVKRLDETMAARKPVVKFVD